MYAAKMNGVAISYECSSLVDVVCEVMRIWPRICEMNKEPVVVISHTDGSPVAVLLRVDNSAQYLAKLVYLYGGVERFYIKAKTGEYGIIHYYIERVY